MSSGHEREENELSTYSFLPSSLRKGRETQEGINVLVSGEKNLNITMAGSTVTEEKRVRKAAKQALTRQKTALENAING